MNVRSRLAWVRPFLMLVLVVTVPVVLYWFGYVNRSVDNAVRQYNLTIVAVATSLKGRLDAHDRIAETAESRGGEDAGAYLKSLVTDGVDSTVRSEHYLQLDDKDGRLLLSVKPKGSSEQTTVGIKLEDLVHWDFVEAEFDGLIVLSSDGHLLAQDRRLPLLARGLPIRISRDQQAVDLAPFFEFAAAPNKTNDGAKHDRQGTGSPSPVSTGSRWRSPTDFSRFETITLAGQQYVAFLQPVRVYTQHVGSSDAKHGASDRETVDMLVAGLVVEDRMRRQARTLSRQTLARVFAIVTFGVLLIPLLKLRFLGTHERMRYRDVLAMATALLGMTAVVVLLLLDGPATRTVRQVLDVGLQELHEQIKGRAVLEAATAAQQLRNFTNGPSFGDALRERSSPQNHAGRPSTVAGKAAASQSKRRTGSAGGLLVGSQEIDYPLVDTIFVADLKGEQVYKWDTRTLPTGLTSVKNRDYFRDALALPFEGTVESSHQGPDNTARDFVVSRASGQEQFVFALPVGKVDDDPIEVGSNVPADQRGHVAALASPMESLQRTVVPLPYEYVLVGRDATVKFRNANGPYLNERFFEQVRGGSVLAPLAADDPARTVDGDFSYRLRQYRMHASDVPEIDMTLVTFYDTEIARELTSRAFGVAACIALLAILSALTGSLLAASWWGRQSHDWLWPDTEDTAHYLVGIVVCVVVILVLVWVRGFLSPARFAVAVTVIPGVVMILCGSPLWFRTRLIWTLGDAQSSPTLYMAAFCGFLLSILALVAVPTALAFDDALRLYLAAYERVAAQEWSRDVFKEARRFEEKYAVVEPPDKPGNCTAPRRICASRGNYARLVGMLIDPSDAAGNESTSSGAAAAEADDSPLRNINLYRSCPPPLLGAPEGPGDKGYPRDCRMALAPDALPWSFTAFLARPLERFGDSGLAFALAQSPRDGTATGSGTTSRSASPTPLSGWTWTAAVPLWIAVGFALLILLIYTVAVHVLGLGWQNRRLLDTARDVAASDGARWLLLGPTRASVRHLSGPTTRFVDLRRLDSATQLVPPATGHTLVVQHVEAALADDVRHEAALSLVAARVEGCLLLCSDIDPLYYVSQRIHEAVDPDHGARVATVEERARGQQRVDALRAKRSAWADALQDFRKVQAVPPEFPALGSELPASLRELLRSECGFSEPMIEIAERLARAPDLASHSENEVIGFILDAARPYYRSLWDLCTEGERLLLIQLADESVVNPRRFDLLRQLHHRGLVLVEPRFQLMNRSFTEFVKNVENRDRVTEMEYTPAALGWKRFSTPLYTLAAVVIAILLYTQQDLVAQMLGIATGAAGALNSLRNIGLLARSSEGKAEHKSANA